MNRPGREPLLLVALALVFLYIVTKAASADITWDEAWTFLHYGRTPFGFLRLDYANNHVLNSIAVHVATTIAGSSVFAIRLPDVLAGLLYLRGVLIVVRSVSARTLAFALLVLNPYLIEHFALARGYGIAAGLLQWGLARNVFARDWDRSWGPLLAVTLLASLAVASDVTILAGLILARTALALRGEAGARQGWVAPSVIAAVLALVPLAILLRETRPGVPVFGSAEGPFGAMAAGVARMFVADRDARPIAALVLAGLAIVLARGRRHLSSRSRFLLFATAGELAAIEAGALLWGKQLPTARLLVPSLPLWGSALVAVGHDLGAGVSLRGRLFSGVVCLVLGIAFLGRVHTGRFLDWPQDAGLEARLVRALSGRPSCLPWDVWSRYGHEYYLDRWFGGRPLASDVPCPGPR